MVNNVWCVLVCLIMVLCLGIVNHVFVCLNFEHLPKRGGVSGEAKLFIEFKYGHVLVGSGVRTSSKIVFFTKKKCVL